MNQNEKYIWYASYGSNLLEERFHCYIRGGQPEGSIATFKGCSDKTLPVENEEIYISRELYFARSSSNWENGGMAFIDAEFGKAQETMGRMYLITREQFIEVVKQEIKHEGELNIDFELAISKGSQTFRPNSYYGHIIYLGEKRGHSIFTFTHQRNYEPTKPSIPYIKTIAKGINEIYPNISKEEIIDYLMPKKGIANNYSKEEITSIVYSIDINLDKAK